MFFHLSTIVFREICTTLIHFIHARGKRANSLSLKHRTEKSKDYPPFPQAYYTSQREDFLFRDKTFSSSFLSSKRIESREVRGEKSVWKSGNLVSRLSCTWRTAAGMMRSAWRQKWAKERGEECRTERNARKKRENQYFVSELAKVFLFLHIDISYLADNCAERCHSCTQRCHMKQTSSQLSGLLLLALGAPLLTACLNDNDTPTPEVSKDCVVTAFQLGTLERTVHTRTRDGLRDTSYVQNLPGSRYAFTIDQERNTIYNLDSLPNGTNLARVKADRFTAIGAARVVSLLTQTDTIIAANVELDLRQPRTIHVYGMDGVSRRNYTLEVRVHREEGDSVTWTQGTEAEWTAQQFSVPTEGVVQHADRYFRVEGNQMLTSTDGQTWQADSVEQSNVYFLPTANVTGTVMTARGVNHVQEWVVYGTQDNTPRIWARKWDTTGTYNFGWELVPAATTTGYSAPVLTAPQLLAYDDGLLLVGRTANGAVVLRYSRDRGRTWVAHPTLALPNNFPTTVNSLQAAVDGRGQLWLHTDNGVWRARLHRLSWERPTTTFEASTAAAQ